MNIETGGMVFKTWPGFWLIALALLNMSYISIEIYKSKFTAPLIDKTYITEAEFSKFETLSSYAYYFEAAFLIVSIVWTLLMLSNKYKHAFRGSITVQLALLIELYGFNSMLSVFFEAPIGNLTQLLWLPVVFAVAAIVYVMLSGLLRKVKGPRDTAL